MYLQIVIDNPLFNQFGQLTYLVGEPSIVDIGAIGCD